ncbi:4,5:9,10-diseco-3-hydroxy-5,9,17-trioxoandrosta-1(10),2-diene-4-oate hydrolase [Phoenix dactylifera]|uniref:4,5:9,10-diseco-3-hydroxy-5,9, 17-trioxoandrosta-1(10),2-diene-4-oate hydrolase n=1 Tax=Phoenix dactylifera TaxID=42345 RepID=A0A8B7CMW6_PHODC|nr:4,5:9,10-diseco-3-hydroxy-5,9,17-trioxoandrosta-1(10),2-diene-4-oate hydrolase [Phoenix dactylifera]
MGLSLVSFMESFLRLSFIAAGLRLRTVAIDADTTLRCWISNSLPISSSNSGPDRRRLKPLLVLIHGFGPSATWQWRHQVRPLSRHFDLVIPDLLFFGGSTTRSPHRSEAFQAASLARLLDALRLSKISVVGTSYGGFVAYHLARALGLERVERVVIASSDVLKSAGDDKGLAERAGVENVQDLMLPRTAANLRALIGLAVHRPPRFMPEFVLRDVVRNLYNQNVEEKKELMRAVTLGNRDEFQLTPLPQDVLIIWGEYDRIFPLEKAYEIKKRLGEKARLEIMKDTAHVPQGEDPEKFNEILLNFLLGAPRSAM